MKAYTDIDQSKKNEIFPELHKSEDEKIRKGIIKYLSWIKDTERRIINEYR